MVRSTATSPRQNSSSGRLIGVLVALAVSTGLGALSFGLDHLNRRLQEQEARVEAAAQLELLRTRIEAQFNAALHVGRGIATALSEAGDITQDRYARFASAISGDLPGVINIALSRDLVVTHVYPMTGNEAVKGIDYRNVPSQLDTVLAVRNSGTATLTGPLSLVQGGRGLILHVPIFAPSEEGAAYRGMLSIVYDLDKFLEVSGLNGANEWLDFVLETETNTFLLSRHDITIETILNDAPIKVNLLPPERSWTLRARPVGGWSLQTAGLSLLRGVLIALVTLVLTVTLTAIWLAVSRRETIREMQATERRLDGMIRNAPGVFMACRDAEAQPMTLEFISERCRDIWEIGPRDFIANPMRIWDMEDPDAAETRKEAVETARRTGRRWHHVWHIRTPSGQEKWLEGWGLPTRLDAKTTLWDIFILDITEAHLKDIAYERQSQIVHQAQKQESIGQLTGGVAHDFNNLLAVIMGNLELLRDDVHHPDQLQLIDSSLKATLRGAELTNNMLAFARKARLVPQRLDLNQVVSDTRNWAGRTLPAHIWIETVLAKDLWPIEADPSSTESAVLNLMLNARDAMAEGGKLRVATRNLLLQKGDPLPNGLSAGRYVHLSVSDTGHGIDAESLQLIFDPFFSTKPPGAGSGLGLSMVQGFMQQSGGAVEARSIPGEGTTFHLYFPAQIHPVATAPATAHPVSDGQRTARILLAEDEPEVRALLVSTLQKAGYTVVATGSGDAALELFQSDSAFDLLLSDIVMPGNLQGPALARALRGLAPALPVIYMSGYASAQAMGQDDIKASDQRLMKPVARDDLLAALDRALSGPLDAPAHIPPDQEA
jgi:signal transduction histidine kinase/ActR/RegA family two-component response regulator